MQRKTILITEHNKLMRRAERTAVRQLLGKTKLANKILELEQEVKNLESSLETTKQNADSEIAFRDQRIELQAISIENL